MNHLHNTVLHGCSKEMLRTIPDNSIGSIVTDPPYELGFMGKKWDNTGIAYDVELWQECRRVLKPGGYILAFSSTRTYHRMAAAIEDAGFEIRDHIAWAYSKSTAFADFFNSLNSQQQKLLEKVMNDDAMLQWSYGSGFPKSHNIGKKVDEIQGNEREVYLKNPNLDGAIRKHTKSSGEFNNSKKTNLVDGLMEYTKGTSEFEGWGTALKPAHEPICMARKPLSEKTVAENCLKWGTGGINIDESRVEYTSEKDKKEGQSSRPNSTSKGMEFYAEGEDNDFNRSDRSDITGRFPANLIHDNSEEVRACFPETKSGKMCPQHTRHTDGSPNGIYGKFDVNHELGETYGDSGNASRFFKSIIYQAKASKSERNKGCEGLEEKIATARMNASEFRYEEGREPTPRAEQSVNKNNHPTVKPIALIQYLVKLVTPPNTISLDPFSGSGTHALACINLNIPYIEIEKEIDHINIINERTKNHKPPPLTLF